MNNRIKIKSQISLLQFIVTVIILLGIVGGLFYFIFTQDVRAKTYSESLAIIPFIFFIISTLYNNLMSKKQYLSDIYIYDNEIILTFKIRDKISKTIPIQKNNIQKFKLDAHIQLYNCGKHSRVDVDYKFFIDLIKGQDISINQLSDLTLVEGNYKFLYRIMDGAKNIPNFEINFTSNSEMIKAELDYYKRFGKKIPLFVVQFKKASIFLKIWYLLLIAGACFCIYCFFQAIRHSIPPSL